METVPVVAAWPAGERGLEPVARLVYASRASFRGSIYAVMEQIRASAVRHNAPADVATALLHQSGWFVQWKEGPGAALLRLMDRVEADPRHHGLRILHSSRGPRLLSGPWSSAIVQCGDTPEDMQARVDLLQRELKHGRQSSPQTVWRRLSTPLRHPGAARQAEVDAFQRVLVCCAEGSDSFALVKWLGRYHDEEVVHRRFAGACNLDVGTDYVDFADDDRVLRLIAMARHGLALPLTRAFLPDYSHIVLLLGDQPKAGAQLMLRVAQACAGLRHAPALVGVGGEARVHGEMFALARRHGLIYLDVQCKVRDEGCWWSSIAPVLAGWRHAVDSGWPVMVPRAWSGSD